MFTVDVTSKLLAGPDIQKFAMRVREHRTPWVRPPDEMSTYILILYNYRLCLSLTAVSVFSCCSTLKLFICSHLGLEVDLFLR